MFFNVLKSEFTKLFTTRAVWFNLIILVLMTLGFHVFSIFMMKTYANDTPGLTVPPEMVAPAITMPGAMILGIMAIIAVTNEYSHKYVSMSFQATPNRVVLALAKLVMTIIVAALLGFILQLIAFPVTQLIVGKEMAPNLGFGNEAVQKFLWKTPIYMAFYVTFAQGLAWLLRSAVAAIVILLGWYMTLETLVIPMIYKVGDKIAPYAPFKNLSAFYRGEVIDKVPWGEWGSLGYFGAWAAVLYIVAMVLLIKRDA
ncbi:hypothetical protein [Corynebacterium sp. H130]|uniref:hypothetical protein n=1 Tax=Corynebacterium sp. H130 TaxID=3133444 RepID=UPI003096D788